MNRFKNYVVMAVGFVVLAAVVSGISAGPAIAALVKAALIKNVDEPGRAVYQSTVTCTGPGGCTINLPVVPANKRLVVKYVSFFVANATAPVGIVLADSTLDPNASLFAESVGVQQWTVNQEMTLFYESGTVPQVFVSGNGAGVNAMGTVTGYLVDLTI